MARGDLAWVAGRRKGGRKVKMGAGGRRDPPCLHARLSPSPLLQTPAMQTRGIIRGRRLFEIFWSKGGGGAIIRGRRLIEGQLLFEEIQ